MDAPMLPNIPVIGACPSCSEAFWFDDAKKVGEIELFASDDSVPGEWRDAKEAARLDENGLLDAIEDGLGNTPERTKHLRLSAWHAFNDQFRSEEGSQKAFEPSERQKSNLQELEKLFQWSDEWDDMFILAEVCRQLGNFEKARNVLNHINVDFIVARKSLITDLCAQQSKLVGRIPLEDENA